MGKAWKAFETESACLFGGKRFFANSGERLDFAATVNSMSGEPSRIAGQVKLTKTLSLEALTKLAEEPRVDVVCVKRRRGKGHRSAPLVVFTFENYRRLHQ